MLTENHKLALKELIMKLDENGIWYQITGGLAAYFYGAKRKVADIDVDVLKKDIPKIQKIFKTNIKQDYFRYVDKSFDFYLIQLEINGIEIDISQYEDAYFKDVNGKAYGSDPENPMPKIFKLDDLKISVQDINQLMNYKNIIRRKVDIDDCNALQHILSKPPS